jgi:hypothetical protein
VGPAAAERCAAGSSVDRGRYAGRDQRLLLLGEATAASETARFTNLGRLGHALTAVAGFRRAGRGYEQQSR